MAKNILWYLPFLIILPLSMVTAEENQSGNVFDLGQVLVTGAAEKSDKITTTETISIEDIKMQGATTVAEVLEFVPGVDIQTGKKGQSSVRLRGFKQSAVKILIDGVPAHESYFGSLDLGQISIDSVAQIKIIKGASSVLYGPNTMGGIINCDLPNYGRRFCRISHHEI